MLEWMTQLVAVAQTNSCRQLFLRAEHRLPSPHRRGGRWRTKMTQSGELTPSPPPPPPSSSLVASRPTKALIIIKIVVQIFERPVWNSWETHCTWCDSVLWTLYQPPLPLWQSLKTPLVRKHQSTSTDDNGQEGLCNKQRHEDGETTTWRAWDFKTKTETSLVEACTHTCCSSVAVGDKCILAHQADALLIEQWPSCLQHFLTFAAGMIISTHRGWSLRVPRTFRKQSRKQFFDCTTAKPELRSMDRPKL